MINILPVEEWAHLPVVVVPGTESADHFGSACTSDGRCAAYCPDPQPSGNLQVDPDILLPSPGMDVQIALYYNSATWPAAPFANGPYGAGRTMSPSSNATIYNSGNSVIIQRGSGAIVSYAYSGGSWGASTPGVLNSLVVDNVHNLIKETTPEGITTAYPLDSTGHPQTMTWAQDAVGNTHSYLYSSGLLQNIQDGSGRLVTFAYSGGLLQSIQDWAGRITSFAFDTHSLAPLNLLTTVTGPTGCQTQYQYTEGFWAASTIALLTGIIDPNGYAVSYTYDSAKLRVTSKKLPGVGTTTYAYAASGGSVAVTDALGHVTTQLYMGDGSFAYTGGTDPLGNVTTITRNANDQRMSY